MVTKSYRPGPLDAEVSPGITMAEQYVRNKDPKILAQYLETLDPRVRNIFATTRGILVYQEQIQELAKIMAGYSLGGADLLRRAMSDKNKALIRAVGMEFVYGTEQAKTKAFEYLEANKHLYSEKDFKAAWQWAVDLQKVEPDKYVPGAIQMGFDEEYAIKTYDQIVPFSGYAFNKSHSCAYADLSYQTAYLKVYYPHEFIAAFLTADSDDKDKIKVHLAEAKKIGVRVLPPDINQSRLEYGVTKLENGEKIVRYGLQGITKVGPKAALAIIGERMANGPFTSLQNFCERMRGNRSINKTHIMQLIKAGAFDSFIPDRHEALNTYLRDIYALTQSGKAKQEILDQANLPVPTPTKDLVKLEEETINICLSFNPIADVPISYTPWSIVMNGEKCAYAIKVARIKEHSYMRYGNQETMAFVDVETLGEPISITLFADKYQKYKKHLESGEVLVVRGKKEVKMYKGEEKISLIPESFIYASNYKPEEEEEQPKLNLTPKPNPTDDLYEAPPPAPKEDKMASLFLPRINLTWDFF